MSSATSIDRVNAETLAAAKRRPRPSDTPHADTPTPAEPAAEKPGGRSDDAFRPWHFFVLASVLAATTAVLLGRESRPEHLVLISITIGAAGAAAGALYRTLLPLVRRDAAAPGGRELTQSMRVVLEREKALALRSIKELEFDRAMGKVSARDFEEMAARLRARAMSLIRQLDQEGAGYRELIERELSARLAARSRERSATAVPQARAAAPASAPATCSCGTANDPDAAFCKRCGGKLLPAGS